jgi:hypothetical protein
VAVAAGIVKRVVMVAGALAALAGAVALVVMGPQNIVGLVRPDRWYEGSLKVGDRAPDVSLLTTDGATVHFVDRFSSRPTVLIIGSFT